MWGTWCPDMRGGACLSVGGSGWPWMAVRADVGCHAKCPSPSSWAGGCADSTRGAHATPSAGTASPGLAPAGRTINRLQQDSLRMGKACPPLNLSQFQTYEFVCLFASGWSKTFTIQGKWKTVVSHRIIQDATGANLTCRLTIISHECMSVASNVITSYKDTVKWSLLLLTSYPQSRDSTGRQKACPTLLQACMPQTYPGEAILSGGWEVQPPHPSIMCPVPCVSNWTVALWREPLRWPEPAEVKGWSMKPLHHLDPFGYWSEWFETKKRKAEKKQVNKTRSTIISTRFSCFF